MTRDAALVESAHLRVLAEVSHAFASVVTNYQLLLETIARTTADRVGDGCQVTLIGEDGESLFNAASAHRDPVLEADYRTYLAGMKIPKTTSGTVSATVIRTGEAKLVREVQPQAMVAQTDDIFKPLVARLNVHSFIVVPIRARTAVIGALALLRSRPGCAYTAEDVTLLEDLADRAGLAIENARLYDELERRVRQRTAALEAVNQELDAFSFSVAHDLRSPLRSIDGFSRAVLEDCADQLDDHGKKYLGHVRKSAQQMTRLIDDLLLLSRVTRSELCRQRVDLSALARSIAARLELTGDRRVELVVQDGLVAQGDATLLGVVLANLIGNAWKFTARRPVARIEVGAQASGPPLVYFVRDDGAGFDMAYAKKLFGVFQRLHSVQEFEGTGIGLATVQRVVRRHGGRVWAEGEVDKGATFYFTLEGADEPGTRGKTSWSSR
jgi:signal transduction histidine kinase